MASKFKWSPISPAWHYRQSLGQYYLHENPFRAVAKPRIVPIPTNRKGRNDSDHRLQRRRRVELLASLMPSKHEPSRDTLDLIPTFYFLNFQSSSSSLSSLTQLTSYTCTSNHLVRIMASAQKDIKTPTSPSSNRRPSVSTSASRPVHFKSIFTSSTALLKTTQPFKKEMISDTVNRTSLHPGGVQ